jgi:elongation factor P
LAIDTSDFRNGIALDIDGEVYVLLEFQHVKPGKGGAFVRTRIRKVKNGSVIERTFRSGEKFESPYLEHKDMQFLFRNTNDGIATLMDMESYEQVEVPLDMLPDGHIFIKDESMIQGLAVNDSIVNYELPNFVELLITEAEPGIKGDTASGGSTKGAVVETGAKVQVPYHINEGDTIKIDVREGSYVERVTKK